MDDRPNTSIWGTILSCAEIALCVYQVVAVKGEGLMIPSNKAGELLGDKALFQGRAKNGFIHYDKDSPGEMAAAYELVKNGHITAPEIIEQYGTPEDIEADGRFLNPEYFGGLPEPAETPWGTLKTQTPLDNGVFLLSADSRTGIAIHKTVSEYCMSDYSRAENCWEKGDFYFYDLNQGAAIAVFELSASHPPVLDLITSWESLMHTLATEFPDYTNYWNSQASPDTLIYYVPAPSFMFLQQHLDEAVKNPLLETTPEDQETDNFFERADPFDDPEIE
ncbi:hypothetical protein [Desulfosporosinus lacus]|uniref:Uncharacterized protein n=1 Tax=Desulfosporosinus lacus DSM 15449 TaxID=1121420 RepID=A0A1M5V1C4_9FIRM|nr:hypothetical protein [Desulfosporosinus lacus]SHH69031.1 hypothetical protein SAMN02746098_01157 [Desulfosporosinus lacus DSM 15449]